MIRPKTNIVDGYTTNLPQEYFKGKSINNAGTWKKGVHYVNDAFWVDLVSFRDSIELPDGKTKTTDIILACKKNHISDNENIPHILYDDHFEPYGVSSSCWTYMMHGGLSMTAYDIAVAHGYEGSEEEWIRMIQKQVITSEELVEINGVPLLDETEVVRYDIDQTDKNDDKKARARNNIGAPNIEDMLVAEKIPPYYTVAKRDLSQTALVWEPQQLTPSQLSQAQENLHIADESRIAYMEQKLGALDAAGITTIGDLRNLTTILWDNDRQDVPAFFVDAMNNLMAYLGDPELDQVKIDYATDDTIGSINKLYQLITDKDHVIKEMPAEMGSTTAKYTVYSAKTGLPIDGNAIIEVPRNNYIKEAFMVEGGIDSNNNYVAGGTGHRFIDFIMGFDKADPYTGKPYTKVTDVYICVDGLSYFPKDESLNTSATIQTAVTLNGVSGYSEISADIIEGRVDRKHLTPYVNMELNFVDYAHEDADAPARYIRCRADDPDAIEVTDLNKNTIFASIKNMGFEEIGTYVKTIPAGTQLNTYAQTLREAVNELHQAYPVVVQAYENGVTNPYDGETATEGSKYTYVFKQSRDEDNMVEIGRVEVPLSYSIFDVKRVTAEGGEWIGNTDDPDQTDPDFIAEEGDMLLKITVTNGALDEYGQVIYKDIYCRLDPYTVKDEVTGNDITIHGDAYDTPEDLLAAFENDPQMQLYISGFDNELSGKLIFEDDEILGEEIIP